jgi:oxalate---CoA ligase
MTTPRFATLRDAIDHWAAVAPDTPALELPGRVITYATLQDLADQWSGALLSHGIGPGSVVAILLPHAPDAVLATLLTSAAAPAAALDPTAPAPELERIAALLHPTVVITTPDLVEHAGALGCPVLPLGERFALPPGSAPAPPEPVPPGPDDIAVILATSGSTGVPRLVPRRHRQLIAGTLPYAATLEISSSDRSLNVGRPAHAISSSPAIMTLLTGGTTIFPSSADPRAVLQTIRDGQPTWVIAGPSWFSLLLAALADQPAPRSFRTLISAGAPLSPALAEAATAAFGAPVVNDYGMSEAMNIALALPGHDGALQPCTPGSVAIAGPDGALLPPGESGEIVTQGEHVFTGYLEEDDATSSAVRPDGWFRTGDLGVMSEDGSFRITGRIADLINRGGERISPVEIESVLLAHPAVADAAVFGAPDPVLGEDLRAAVVLRPGQDASARALRRWLLERLAPAKVPRHLSFHDGLPQTATGKLVRSLLREFTPEAAANPEPEIVEIESALITGPVRVIAPVTGIGRDGWAMDRVATAIEPRTRLAGVAITGRVPNEALLGRRIRLGAGPAEHEFTLHKRGAFRVEFALDLPAGIPAQVVMTALDPWIPASGAGPIAAPEPVPAKPDKAGKKKRKATTKKQPERQPAPDVSPAPGQSTDRRRLAFVPEAIEFLPADHASGEN